MNGINNNIAFRGVIGDKYVRQITQDKRTVFTDTLMKEAKGFVGLDSGRVHDIFDSFVNGLINEVKEKTAIQEQFEKMREEAPKRIQEEVKHAEEGLASVFRRALQDKNKEIDEREKKLMELRRYESMAKVKSIDEIDTVMPETAINTAKEMREHRIEARESMLNYLLTGKGQEAALEQTERSNILIKAMQDGITEIPDVAEAIKGVSYADTAYFLKSLMELALRSEKGSIIISPVLRAQVKDNMLGLLLPHADERYSNTGAEGIKREVDYTLESLLKFQQNLAKRKQEIRNEYTDPISKIVYNQDENRIYLFNNEGEQYAKSYLLI